MTDLQKEIKDILVKEGFNYPGQIADLTPPILSLIRDEKIKELEKLKRKKVYLEYEKNGFKQGNPFVPLGKVEDRTRTLKEEG